MNTLKKIVFYFNAAALSYSYLYLFLLIMPEVVWCAPEGLKKILVTVLTPIEFIFDAVMNLNEFSSAMAYILALLLSVVIVPILTLIFLRKDLSKSTFSLLALSFIIPLSFFLTAILCEDILVGNDLLTYILLSVYIIALLAYNITTLVFMFRDIDELD